MVLAIQCPAPKCRKFMLVEDHDKGRTVQCLICKAPIKLNLSKDRPTANPNTSTEKNSVN